MGNPDIIISKILVAFIDLKNFNSSYINALLYHIVLVIDVILFLGSYVIWSICVEWLKFYVLSNGISVEILCYVILVKKSRASIVTCREGAENNKNNCLNKIIIIQKNLSFLLVNIYFTIYRTISMGGLWIDLSFAYRIHTAGFILISGFKITNYTSRFKVENLHIGLY